MKILLRWFKFTDRESGKVSIFGSSEIPTVKILSIGPIDVRELNLVELLGITIDEHLDFEKYIENLCWNANCKLHALRRMRKYVAGEKAKLLGYAFIKSQFNSALLI